MRPLSYRHRPQEHDRASDHPARRAGGRSARRPPQDKPVGFKFGIIPGPASRPAKTIAIIGHGRSPEGTGWGPRIDACDCVIRMWDCHWQNPADFGRRYDIGFFEVHPSLLPKFKTHNKRKPRLGWLGSLLLATPKEILPDRTELVDQSPWNEVGHYFGGKGMTGRLQFTRGTIATLWAIENAHHGAEIIP